MGLSAKEVGNPRKLRKGYLVIISYYVPRPTLASNCPPDCNSIILLLHLADFGIFYGEQRRRRRVLKINNIHSVAGLERRPGAKNQRLLSYIYCTYIYARNLNLLLSEFLKVLYLGNTNKNSIVGQLPLFSFANEKCGSLYYKYTQIRTGKV